MARTKINQILGAPDKGVSRTHGLNGILSRLFRQLLMNLNVTPMYWGSLMNDFIKDVRNGVPNNKRDQTSIRGNLTKEFARTQMTWKVFCKGLRFLQITNIKITIEATHRERQYPTVVSVDVNLGGVGIKQLVEETAEPEIEGETEFVDEKEESSH